MVLTLLGIVVSVMAFLTESVLINPLAKIKPSFLYLYQIFIKMFADGKKIKGIYTSPLFLYKTYVSTAFLKLRIIDFSGGYSLNVARISYSCNKNK